MNSRLFARRAIAASSIAFVAWLVQACSSRQPPAPLEREDHRVVDIDPATETADLIVEVDPLAPTAVGGMTHEQAARMYIAQNAKLLGLRDPSKQLLLEEVAISPDGTAAVHFRQQAGGYVIEDVVLSVRFRSGGSIAMVSGPIAPDADLGVVAPVVDAQGAVAAAESWIAGSAGGFDPNAVRARRVPTLVLRRAGKSARLVWKLAIEGDAAGAAYGFQIFVDARSGAIGPAFSTMLDVGATGAGVHGDRKSFEARDMPDPAGRYALYQGGIGGPGGRERIMTFSWSLDAAGNNVSTLVRSNDVDSWDRVAVGAGAAVDAHTYTAVVDDWYRQRVGWASYDGRGSQIWVIVHDNRTFRRPDGSTWTNHENAFWDWNNGMHFGDGNAPDVVATSAGLDIVAHELTHGVNQHTNQLEYVNETGALNEALSDIFSQFVELDRPAPGHVPYVIGEPAWVKKGGLRDFRDPARMGQPDHYSKRYTGAGDNGGVHVNSGIINNAWFLMTIGGKNPTSQIAMKDALWLETSRKLWWQSLRHEFKGQPTFEKAARAQMGWAKTNGYSMKAVACAWVATGVIPSDYVEKNYGEKCFCANPDGGVATYEELKCCEGGQYECCKFCAPPPPPEPPPPTPLPEVFDTCIARGDGVYCSQLNADIAIVCRNGLIVSGLACPSLGTKCLGPNGPGDRILCEGGPGTGTPDPGPPTPPTTSDCADKADGWWCMHSAPGTMVKCMSTFSTSGCPCNSCTQGGVRATCTCPY